MVSPFLQGGVGAMRYEVESGFLNTTATNVAYNVGGGVDVQLTPNLGLRLMAKDYIGKFDKSAVGNPLIFPDDAMLQNGYDFMALSEDQESTFQKQFNDVMAG